MKGQRHENAGLKNRITLANIISPILATLRQFNWRSVLVIKTLDRGFKYQIGDMVRIKPEHRRHGDYVTAGEVTGYNRVIGTVDEFRVSWHHDQTAGWFKEYELQMVCDDGPETLH